MVKDYNNKMRVGKDFLSFKNTLKKQIEPSFGRRISDTEITDSISNFVTSEDLLPIMIRRAKNEGSRRKRRGGLF